MSEQEIIKIIREYVKNECYNEVTGHDWWHIQRVYNNAMLINEKENANKFVLTIIVLMHDLYDHKFYKGNIKKAIEETLKKLNIYNYIAKTDIENIIYSCENLGYSSNISEIKRLSVEGRIATRCR